MKIMFKSNQIICYLFRTLIKNYLFLFFASLFFTTIKCESRLHAQLNYYEVIHSIDLKHNKIVKRSAETRDLINESVDHFVSFRAINRDFNLQLTQNKDIISSHLKAFTVDSNGRKRPLKVDLSHHYSGRVDGIDGSRVSAHIDPTNGLLTASIYTVDDVYEVEPIWRHSETERNNKTSMIVFKHSDVKHSNTSKHFCDFVKIDDNITDEEIEVNHWVRQKREAVAQELRDDNDYDYTPTATHCTLALVADYLFYQNMGYGDTQVTTNYMIHIIDRVNNIFKNTEWNVEESKPGFKGMGLFVKEIQIYDKPTLEDNHFNSPDLTNISPNKLLELFSLQKENSQFCLAHLFTHRKFENSVLGLAYVAGSRLASVGGICSGPYDKRDENNPNIFRSLSLNTGLTTTQNVFGQRIITREAVLVTAHEFGHNWGSEHDPHTDECSPRSGNGGSYIMYTFSVTGYEENNRFFSPCSRRSIHAVLIKKASRCFIKPEKAYCGNNIVEEGEDCDEGLLLSMEGYEQGLCCDQRCRFLPGSDCSDRNSKCCAGCRVKQQGLECKRRDEFNCKKESVCDGETDRCPEPTAIEDYVPCFDRGQCRSGRCMSYCESIGEITCMCEDIRDGCVRCCKPRNGSCRPISPRDGLPDGTPCRFGFCEKQRCEKRVQDFVERFWDVIEEININTFVIFMKDNIVGVVIIVSLIIWIPLSCAITYYDKALAEERRRRSASLQSDLSRRRITRGFSRRLTRPGLSTNGIAVSNQAYYPFGY